ncbi:MAG: FlgD immunoglobulin-like domain containing protein [Christensenellaceae bacterium]|nr:FlgD immunoglobulin-like domain containing protein [Christensenellaceae bacterium]
MKRILSMLLAVMCLAVFLPSAAMAGSSSGDGKKYYRSINIGIGDYNSSRYNLSPAPENDATALRDAMRKSGYKSALKLTNSNANTLAKLKARIKKQFGSADADDVSVLTYSGHGAYANGRAAIALNLNEYVTADQLAECFADIKGKVVLIIDACNSGGLIGRSAFDDSSDSFADDFCGEFQTVKSRSTALTNSKFKVLCASRTEMTSLQEAKRGLFSANIAYAMGVDRNNSSYKEFPADENCNGMVSLNELYTFVTKAQPSTPCSVYPQKDYTCLAAYNKKTGTAPKATLGPVKVDYKKGTVAVTICAKKKVSTQLAIYTVNENKVRNIDLLALYPYQTNPSISGVKRVAMKKYTVAAGKSKTITLPLKNFSTAVYAYRLYVDGQSYSPVSGVSVTNETVVPELVLSCDSSAVMSAGDEFDLLAACSFSKPLTSAATLSCTVTNSKGEKVRTLADKVPAEALEGTTSGGSTYYICNKHIIWDGKDDKGKALPDGKYTFNVTANYASGSISDKVTVDFVFKEQENAPELSDGQSYTNTNYVELNAELNDAAKIYCDIYDVIGNKVCSVAEGAETKSGPVVLNWDYTSDGARVDAGQYTAKIWAENKNGRSGTISVGFTVY